MNARPTGEKASACRDGAGTFCAGCRSPPLAADRPCGPALQEAFRAIGETMITEWVETAGEEAGAVVEAYRAR